MLVKGVPVKRTSSITISWLSIELMSKTPLPRRMKQG